MYISEKFPDILRLVECIKAGFDNIFELEKNNGYNKIQLFSEYLNLPYSYGFIPITEVDRMPDGCGLYFLLSPTKDVLYVGMSQNLSSRFQYLPDSINPNTLIYEDHRVKVGHTQIADVLNRKNLSPYTDDINIGYIAFDQIDKQDLLALEGFSTYVFGLSNASAYKKFYPSSSRYKKDLQERLNRIDRISNFWLCLEGSFPVEPRFGDS